MSPCMGSVKDLVFVDIFVDTLLRPNIDRLIIKMFFTHVVVLTRYSKPVYTYDISNINMRATLVIHSILPLIRHKTCYNSTFACTKTVHTKYENTSTCQPHFHEYSHHSTTWFLESLKTTRKKPFVLVSLLIVCLQTGEESFQVYIHITGWLL